MIHEDKIRSGLAYGRREYTHPKSVFSDAACSGVDEALRTRLQQWAIHRAALLAKYVTESGNVGEIQQAEDAWEFGLYASMAIMTFSVDFHEQFKSTYALAEDSQTSFRRTFENLYPFTLDSVIVQSLSELGKFWNVLDPFEDEGELSELKVLLRSIDRMLGSVGLGWEEWTWDERDCILLDAAYAEHSAVLSTWLPEAQQMYVDFVSGSGGVHVA
jgi:hypothetical protein